MAKIGMTLLDARRGQVFAGLYARVDDAGGRVEHDESIGCDEKGGAWRVLVAPTLTRIDPMLERAGGPVFVIGEGIAMHREALERIGARSWDEEKSRVSEASIWLCPESMWRCRAEVVGRLGDARAHAGHVSDVWGLEPLYVRRAEAEEKRMIAAGLLNADGTERVGSLI
jgi:hypothetical protein